MSLWTLITVISCLAIALTIVVPFAGTLVRFRANFNPKGLQLDSEGNAQPHTGPVIKSYFGMMIRVAKIEGIAGLYKGLMPNLITTVLIGFVIFLNYDEVKYTSESPQPGIVRTLIFSLVAMIVALPGTIVTIRAICTPQKLPYFNPMTSLMVLFTATERKQPWRLYLTPGLLAAQSLHIAYSVVGLRLIRNILLPELSRGIIGPKIPELNTFGLVVYTIIVMASTAILTPLEVMATRLAIQRNHLQSQYSTVSQEEHDPELGMSYAGEEDVIGLRSEGDPYSGLIDCWQRMNAEEGKRALYRAWWLTMLGGLFTAFA